MTLVIFIAAVLICSAILSASNDICRRLLEIERILNMMQDDNTTPRLKVGDQ